MQVIDSINVPIRIIPKYQKLNPIHPVPFVHAVCLPLGYWLHRRIYIIIRL